MPGMSECNYKFLDCGNGRRLEKIGRWLIDRPAPQADWDPGLSESEWNMADAVYRGRGKSGTWDFRSPELKQVPEDFRFIMDSVVMELRFSENGQIGIYPEQIPNWEWLSKQTGLIKEPAKVLNGFAYTGGSTLFSSLGGAGRNRIDTCHVDASKSSVNWARCNRDLSGLQEQTIRFVVEDILRFMEREIKRRRTYQGLILDPPAFGRAPGGRTWVLKKDLYTLIDLSIRLMGENPRFILLSCHDPEITPEILTQQIARFPGVKKGKIETLNLKLPSKHGRSLPNGIAARWSLF